jgi:hypothetical protein
MVARASSLKPGLSCGHLCFFMAAWASLWPLELPNGRLGLRKAFLTFLFGKLGLLFCPFFLLVSGLLLMAFVRTYVASVMAEWPPCLIFLMPVLPLYGRLAAKGATWPLGLLPAIFPYFMAAKSSNGWKRSLRLCFR